MGVGSILVDLCPSFLGGWGDASGAHGWVNGSHNNELGDCKRQDSHGQQGGSAVYNLQSQTFLEEPLSDTSLAVGALTKSHRALCSTLLCDLQPSSTFFLSFVQFWDRAVPCHQFGQPLAQLHLDPRQEFFARMQWGLHPVTCDGPFQPCFSMI